MNGAGRHLRLNRDGMRLLLLLLRLLLRLLRLLLLLLLLKWHYVHRQADRLDRARHR